MFPLGQSLERPLEKSGLCLIANGQMVMGSTEGGKLGVFNVSSWIGVACAENVGLALEPFPSLPFVPFYRKQRLPGAQGRRLLP